MSTETGSRTPGQESNSTESHETSTTTQQTASQTTTENARQQVDQILEQTREGFSFEGIVDSIMDSIGNLWRSLGISNLIKYIAGFFGFSSEDSESQAQAQQQAPNQFLQRASSSKLRYNLRRWKALYAQSQINVYNNQNLYRANEEYNYLFKGQTAILMPPCTPDQGNYKIKVMKRNRDSNRKYLYIKSEDFSKLSETNPGHDNQNNTYLTGDSIADFVDIQPMVKECRP